MYVCMYVCMCVCVRACMHACMYVCMYICMYVCMYVYECTGCTGVYARNSILKKLANTNWGTDARTIRTTALALCFSSAEYASPVWSRSSHASKIDPVLNAACRAISRVDDLYLLCGIDPPHIRRAVSSQLEKLKQENDPLHPLYEQDPARKRLKSRRSFLHSVEPLDGSARIRRLNLWSSHLQTTPHKLSFSPKESLAPDSSEAWPTWSSLNRPGQGLDDANPLCRNGDSTRKDRQCANVGMNRP